MFNQIKKLKQNKRYQQDLEKGWDDRFYLYKIQDYSPLSIKGKKIYQTNKNQKNNLKSLKNSKISYIKEYENQNNSGKIENFIEPDDELSDLWNYLGVTQKYRSMFLHNLLYFNETFHGVIIEIEKQSLRQVNDLICKITSDLVNRKKILLELEKNIIFFQNEKNIHSNDKKISEIKQNLKLLMNHTVNIFLNVFKLRKSIAFDITNGKFDLKKINSSYIFESNFLLKLNADLTFIRDSQVGTLLNIQNNFDPFLTETLSSEDNLKSLNESCYHLLNEIIFTNVTLGKNFTNFSKNVHKLRKIASSSKKMKREYVNADNSQLNKKRDYNNNIVTKEELEKTFNEVDKKINFDNHCREDNRKDKREESDSDKGEHKLKKSLSAPKIHLGKEKKEKSNENSNNSSKFSNLPEVNDNYINDNDTNLKNLPNEKENFPKEKIEFSFYTDDIKSLSKKYKNYYKKIPQRQISAFNIQNEINDYIEKSINPIVITSYNKKKEISSLIILSYLQEEQFGLSIMHISSIKEELNELIQQAAVFINNNINYDHIFIDLFYENENGKLTLNKEINDIFKKLKFKWVKLENLENGVRYQKLKLKNNKYCPSSESRSINSITTKPNSVLNIQSALVLYCGDNEKKMNTENNNELYKNTNLFHLQVCEKAFKNSTDKISKMSSLFTHLKYVNTTKIEELKKQLIDGGIEMKINNQNDNSVILSSLFNITSMFEYSSSVEIKNKKYNRIKGKIDVLYNKEFDQTFYMILTKDSMPIIIGEISKKFKKFLYSNEHGNNIYEKFNSIYPKLEACDDKKQKNINSIYIPYINKTNNTNSSDILNSKIDDIYEVNDYFKLSFQDNNFDINKSIKILPTKEDIVISKEFFFALINIGLLNEFNIPCVFCSILDS